MTLRRDRLTSLGLLVLFDLGLSQLQWLPARMVVLSIVLVVPGAVLLSASGTEVPSPFVRIWATVAASLGLLTLYGLVGSVLLPHLGLARPLSAWPTAVFVNLVVLIPLGFVRGRDPVLELFRSWPRLPPALVGAALLPVLAVGAVERLNNGSGSALVQVVIGVTVLALGIGLVLAWRGQDLVVQLLLFSASLGLLYLYAYRGTHLFGYDIQREYQRFLITFRADRWRPAANGDPYDAMLSITALPAELSRLSAVSGQYLFRGVYPLLVAALPGLVYELGRRWLPGRSAYVAAAYMVVLPDFAGQMPALARQEVAFFFFALLALALFSVPLSRRRRQITGAVLLSLVVVSHYSTSYVTVLLLAATWTIYGVARLWLNRSPRDLYRLPKPIVTLPLVVLGFALIVGWDVGVTNSAGNVSSFVGAVSNNGLDLLPSQNQSLIVRYLNGNIQPTLSPAAFYRQARQEARVHQRWERPFPASLVDRYPPKPAPPAYELPARLPLLGSVAHVAYVVVDQLFLLGIVVGAVLAVDRNRKRIWGLDALKPRLAPELSALSVAVLALLALSRLSGTIAYAYNSDRVQLQLLVLMVAALGISIEWIMARSSVLTGATIAGGLGIFLLYTSGESAMASGGGAPVLLANGGTGYEYFFISDAEAAAARWLVRTAPSNAAIYTDNHGPLRVWDATLYERETDLLLTPQTISQHGWVYATAYNVGRRRAYGEAGGRTTVYLFPNAFLDTAMNVVYSAPTTRIWH